MLAKTKALLLFMLLIINGLVVVADEKFSLQLCLEQKDSNEIAAALSRKSASQAISMLVKAFAQAPTEQRAKILTVISQLLQSETKMAEVFLDTLGNREQRLYSAEIWRQLGEKHVTILCRGLTHHDDEIKAQVVEILANLGEPASLAVEPLLAFVASNNIRLRHKAIQALGRIGLATSQVIDSLLQIYQKDDEDAKIWATIALGELQPTIKSQQVAAALLQAATSDNRSLQIKAQTALAKMGSTAVDSLIPLLQHPNLVRRQQACSILGQIGSEARSAIPHLVDLLKSPNLRLQTSSLQAIGQIGNFDENTIEVLIPLLDHTTLGQFSCQALEKAENWEKRLLVVLKTGSTQQRLLISAVIARWHHISENVIDALVAQLDDQNSQIANASCKTLGQIGPRAKKAIPYLLLAIQKNEKGPINLWAITALINIGEPAVLPVAKMLQHQQPIRRQIAAAILLKTHANGEDAIPFLLQSADDPDPLTRRLVVRALAKIAWQIRPTVAVLRRKLRDPDSKVRLCAVEALIRCYLTAPEDVIEAFRGAIQTEKEHEIQKKLRWAMKKLGR